MANMINKDYITTKEVTARKYDSTIQASSNVMANYVKAGVIPRNTKVHVTTASLLMTGYSNIPIYNLADGRMIQGQSDINSLKPSDAKSDTKSQTKNANMKYLYLAVIGVVGVLAYKKFKK